MASAAEMREALAAERHSIQSMLRSCGWQTRERADAVMDVLDSAHQALRRSNAAAVDATFDALRQLAAGDLSEEEARELELRVHCDLAEKLEVEVGGATRDRAV